MAKIRFTSEGQTPNKKRFKRNLKIKLICKRTFVFCVIAYVIHKENLIKIILDLLQ